MNDPRKRAIQEKCEQISARVGALRIDAALERASEVAQRVRGLTPSSTLTPGLCAQAEDVETA